MGRRPPVVPYQQYQVLSGHAFRGSDDNYIRQNLRRVELAGEVIERYYFSSRGKQEAFHDDPRPPT